MNKPAGILNSRLGEAGKHYLTNRGKLTVGDLFFEQTAWALAYAELFEQLILFDRISVSLEPFNTSVISVLAQGFGSLDELMRAIELEVVEIVMPQTSTMVGLGPHGSGRHDPMVLCGSTPLVSGQISGGALSDPFEALYDGLKYLPGVSDKKKRQFAKGIKHYVRLGSLTSDAEAIGMITDAYERDQLRAIGMPFVGNINALTAEERTKLQGLTKDLDDMIFLAENNYGVYGNSPLYSLAKSTIGQIEDLLHVQKSTDHILETMAYPNLRELFINKKAKIKDAIIIRESTDGIGFRGWIHEHADPQDRAYLIRKFLEATPRGLGSGLGGEALKGVTMNAFSKIPGAGATAAATAIGTLVAGPVGTVVGAIAGFAIEVGGGLLADKLAGPLFNGFVPRQFTDRIKSLAEPEVSTE
jgi:hypothetical protein